MRSTPSLSPFPLAEEKGESVLIMPAYHEVEALPGVLEELRPTAASEGCQVVVGVNGGDEATAAVARSCGVLAALTAQRGYGHGCEAAIALARAHFTKVRAFVFMAADGANDPADLGALLATHRERGVEFVLGSRTRLAANRPVMGRMHWWVNRLLGAGCGLLAGRTFSDLGPFRLITNQLHTAIAPRELTYGYTAESQIVAPRLGAACEEIAVRERRRSAGKQKISGVNPATTLKVGGEILLAALRTRVRLLKQQDRPTPPPTP